MKLLKHFNLFLLVTYVRNIVFSTMQNTESGRKINQAMASTGKAVVTTSKAVGK